MAGGRGPEDYTDAATGLLGGKKWHLVNGAIPLEYGTSGLQPIGSPEASADMAKRSITAQVCVN
jgi:hypothetical protein